MSWPMVPLVDLLSTSIGGVWGKLPGEDECDVRVWRVTELKRHGSIDPSTAACRSVSKRQFSTRALQPGDLLLEKSGGGPKSPVGRVGLVTSVSEPAICSNFMQLLRLRLDVFEPKFFHFYLNHLHDTGGTAHMQVASTNIRNIKASEYVTTPVPVPPLDEQRRIVDLLEDHLSRLDAGDFGIAKSLKRLDALRSSALAGGILHAKAAVGDQVTNLGDLGRVTTGMTPLKGNKAFYENGTIPWITSGDLHRRVITEASQFVTEHALAETSLKLVPSGAILIAMYGEGRTRGTAAELAIAATTNQACAAVTLNEPDLRSWVRMVLDANYETMPQNFTVTRVLL